MTLCEHKDTKSAGSLPSSQLNPVYVALQKWHNKNQFMPVMMEKDTEKIIKYACADSCTTTMTVQVILACIIKIHIYYICSMMSCRKC